MYKAEAVFVFISYTVLTLSPPPTYTYTHRTPTLIYDFFAEITRPKDDGGNIGDRMTNFIV